MTENLISTLNFWYHGTWVAREVENFMVNRGLLPRWVERGWKKKLIPFQRSGINVDSLLIDCHFKNWPCLFLHWFILIGTPLSLSSKDSRSVSILLLSSFYYCYCLFLLPASLHFPSFGKNGKLDPLLAAWLPNIIFGIIGLILLLGRRNGRTELLPGSPGFPFLGCHFLLL